MNIEQLREFCLSLPYVTEDIKWEKDLCFSVGAKLFCVCGLEAGPDWRFSFKCTPEKFANLTEKEGFEPAPYAAKHHWVAVNRPDALDDADFEDLISSSYFMVLNKLPVNLRKSLTGKHR